MGNLRLAPPLPVIPEELHGKPIVGAGRRPTPARRGRREGPRAAACPRTPGARRVVPKPYVAHQKMFDAAVPHGRHYYWKSHQLGPLTDDVIDIVCEHSRRSPRRCRSVPIFTFGGAVRRVPEDATAFPHRDATHDINIVASWLPEQAGDADRHIAWVRGFFDALEPHSRGVYVNFTSDDAAVPGARGLQPAPRDRLRRAVWAATRRKPTRRLDARSRWRLRGLCRNPFVGPPPGRGGRGTRGVIRRLVVVRRQWRAA